MCGIAGVVCWKNLTQKPDHIKVLNTLNHRGPDNSAYISFNHVQLYHSRLSILDLSNEANQPMSWQDAHIVFNGEIYNYRELIQSENLTGLQTTSDTEVILHLYLKYGVDFVKKLHGMFAIALYDRGKNKCILLRDRVGIKPLYFYRNQEMLVFASEPKSLFALGTPKNLDHAAIRTYLEHGDLETTRNTFFTGVHSLVQGAFLEIDCNSGKTNQKRYWEPPINEEGNYRFDDDTHFQTKMNELNDLYQQSINSHLISDVPICISLSSGLDSQFLTHTIPHDRNNEYHAFTFGYPMERYDEVKHVKNTHFVAPLQHHFSYIEPSEVISTLREALRFFEMPLGGIGTLSVFVMMKLVREKRFKVILTGEGSDELFGGYKYYFIEYFRDLYHSGHQRILEAELSAYNSIYKTHLTPASIKNMEDAIGTSAPDGTSLSHESFIGKTLHTAPLLEIDTSFSAKSFLRKRMLQDLFAMKIPKLLHFQDRASMASGVEARVPFLDHRLIEFSLQLPLNYLIKNGSTKVLLKQTLKNLHNVSIERDIKHYVATPQREWLKGELFDSVFDLILSGRAVKEQLINGTKFAKMYQDYRNQKKLGNSFFVWKALNLELFLEMF